MTQAEYQPGVCNIGADEIRRRGNAGWIGLVVTAVAFAVLVASGESLVAPAVVLPGSGVRLWVPPSKASVLRRLRGRGIFNFGSLGQANQVVDEEAMAMDRRRGNQIAIYSSLIGAAVAIGSVFVL